MTFQFKLAAFACAGVPVPIYNDGSFSAQWSINSAGLFAEMGTERNGFFVQQPKPGPATRNRVGDL